MPKTKPSELRTKKQLYDERKATNICVDCGRYPADPPRSRCPSCLKKRRDRTRQRVDSGLCPKCNQPAQTGYVSCKNCRIRDAKRADALRKTRRAALLCILCGKNHIEPPYTICEPCRIKKRKREGNYRLDGGNREAIIIRDNSACQLCGDSSHLRVHHIDGTGHTDHANHDYDNLITICRACHHHLHAIARFCTDTKLFLTLVHKLQHT